MANSNNGRDRYMYGICTNRDNGDGKPCVKCAEKTVQQIRAGKDFVCEECGEKLTKVAPPKTTNWPLIGGIAAVVVLGGGAGAYFGLSGSDATGLKALSLNKSSLELIVGDADTLIVANDPADVAAAYIWSSDKEDVAKVVNGIVTAVGEGTAVITVKANENEGATATCSYTVKATTSGLETSGGDPTKTSGGADTPGGGEVPGGGGITKVNLSCAVYDGPTSAGKPNGIGGTLTFNKSYTIDLKDGKGSTLSVGSGDKIVDTKFENGVLKLGELQRKSGERKYFSGVSEKF